MAVLKHLTYLRISNIPTAFVEGTNDQNSECCVATCLIILRYGLPPTGCGR